MNSRQPPDAYDGPGRNSRDDDEAVDDHRPLIVEQPSPVKKSPRLLMFAGPALLLRHVNQHVTLFFIANIYTASLFVRWISLM
jgi:hypothetical protein